DIQDIPLFGREEDGADQIAALIMLQFGPKVAQTTVKGFYNVWHHFNAETLRAQKGQIRPWQEADEHSISIQRAYNFLCMAYGKDPKSFQQLADSLLPRARKQSCEDEYKQAANAFRKTVLPDVDPEMMKAVLQLEILKPEDFKSSSRGRQPRGRRRGRPPAWGAIEDANRVCRRAPPGSGRGNAGGQACHGTDAAGAQERQYRVRLPRAAKREI